MEQRLLDAKNGAWRYPAAVAGVAISSLLTGMLGAAFSPDASPGAVIWLPAGIALAALLLGGYRLWTGVLAGQLLLGLWLDLPLQTLIAAALLGTLSGLLGAFLLRRLPSFDLGLSRARDLFALLLFGGLIPAVSKLGVLLLIGDVVGLDSGKWSVWFIGDVAGVLLASPLILSFHAPISRFGTSRHRLEFWVAFGLLLLSSALMFSGLISLPEHSHLPLILLIAPLLIWIAVRQPLRQTSVAVVLAALIPMLGTAFGSVPFAVQPPTGDSTLIWSMLIVGSLLALLLCVVISAHRRDAQRLRLILEANPNAILLTDNDGRIRLANAESQRLFGYPARELLGKPVEAMMPQRYREQHADYRSEFKKEAGARPMGTGRHLFALRRDGAEIPVEVGLAAFGAEEGGGVLAVIADISQRVDTEVALQQERNFLSTLLDTMDTLVLAMDLEWRVVRFNHACQRVSGYSADEAIGRTVWALNLIPQQELPGVDEIAKLLKQGLPQGDWENHWQHRDGSLHLIAWSNNVIRDEDGNIRYMLATGTEITERRRAEEELERWRTRLVHMDRLATASEMAAGLAHEINQPLTAVAGYCDAAMTLATISNPPNRQLLPLLEKIDHQAQRAGAIIRHLREFIGKAGSDSAWVDANALVRETVEFVQSDVRRAGAELRLELDDDLPPLWTDRVQFEQVLVNLLRNACESMEEAGSEPRKIALTTARYDENRVRVSVRDSGPGVAAAMRPLLFRPFETTKPTGLGMGLAISRSIIEAHGGQLWLEPDTVGGAIFHFTLPLNPGRGDS